MIVVRIEGVPGDVEIPGYDGNKWFVADSMSFGVGKNIQASDSKQDIEIGKNEEQELSIGKTVDAATVYLMHRAMKGRSGSTGSGFFTVDIHLIQAISNDAKPAKAYLKIRIENAMVKSWSVDASDDDRPTESLSIWFSRSAMKYRTTSDGVTFKAHGPLGWDEQLNKDWKPDSLLKNDD